MKNSDNQLPIKLLILRWIARFLSLAPGIIILILWWGWIISGAPGHMTDEQEWEIYAFFISIIITGFSFVLIVLGCISWKWPIESSPIQILISLGLISQAHWQSMLPGFLLLASGFFNMVIYYMERKYKSNQVQLNTEV